MMSLQSVRIISLVALFLETYLVGIVPLYILQKWNKRKDSKVLNITDDCHNDNKKGASLSSNFYIQILLQFGGGVLFATIFAHLIPEVKESFETYSNSNDSIFKNNANEENHLPPYVEIAICIGFFAIFLIEEIMHSCLNRYHEHRKDHCCNRDIMKGCTEVCQVNNDSNCDNHELRSRKSFPNAFVNYGTDLTTETTLNSIHISTISTNTSEKKGNQINDESDEPVFILFLRGFVIIFAFSVHSIFDGLAIGLQKTPSDLWSMFAAITCHKLVISFVVSMELYDQSKRLLIVAFHMALFSIMSPIGILIVIITEESFGTGSENNPIVILLTSLATGTLLYIVFYEILQKDRCDRISGLVQFTAVFVGFSIMLTINLLLSG